jgi:hypothetical protein
MLAGVGSFWVARVEALARVASEWGDVVQLGQRAASSWWGTTNRQLPFGLTEQLRVCKRFPNTITTVRSLGEGALGGRRFVVPHHEEPTQCILTQRVQ